jgi:hypothetical protein
MQPTGNLAETVHAFLAKEISFLSLGPGEKKRPEARGAFGFRPEKFPSWKIV